MRTVMAALLAMMVTGTAWAVDPAEKLADLTHHRILLLTARSIHATQSSDFSPTEDALCRRP